MAWNIAYSPDLTAGGGEDESLGEIGPGSGIDLDTYDIYTIDMADTSYEMFEGATGGSTHTKHTSGWPIGNGGYVTMSPDTATDGETSVGVALGTVGTGIQVLNIRHQARWGSTTPGVFYAASESACKHTFIQFIDGNEDLFRAIFLLASVDGSDGGTYDRSNTLTLVPAANIAYAFGDDVYSEDTGQFYLNGPQGVYWKNGSGDAGTSFQSKSLIPANEVFEVEYRIQTIAQTGYPNGLIAFRIYRSNGEIFERGISWTYDGWATGQTFNDVQMMGAGQWNQGVPGGATFDVGRYITVARDLNAWLGASDELLAS